MKALSKFLVSIGLLCGIYFGVALARDDDITCESTLSYMDNFVCYTAQKQILIAIENTGENVFNTYCDGTAACNRKGLANGGTARVELSAGQSLKLERAANIFQLFEKQTLKARIMIIAQ
jgi:hypothetical protein